MVLYNNIYIYIYIYIYSFIYLQKLINTELNAHTVNTKRKGTTSQNSLEIDKQFYSKLPKVLIQKLYYKIYETDFQMLGYEYPDEYIEMGYDE